MTLADIAYEQIKTLPEPQAREVLDFIGFLKQQPDRAEWRDLMLAQASALQAVWSGAEDEVWNEL